MGPTVWLHAIANQDVPSRSDRLQFGASLRIQQIGNQGRLITSLEVSSAVCIETKYCKRLRLYALYTSSVNAIAICLLRAVYWSNGPGKRRISEGMIVSMPLSHRRNVPR